MRLEPGTAGSPHICSPQGLLKPKQIPHCSSSVGASRFYLLLYVDDIILTASSTTLLRCTIFAAQREFTMKDLMPLHHFLGITVEHRQMGCSSTNAPTSWTSSSVWPWLTVSHARLRSTSKRISL
jgi:hypothetical protein